MSRFRLDVPQPPPCVFLGCADGTAVRVTNGVGEAHGAKLAELMGHFPLIVLGDATPDRVGAGDGAAEVPVSIPDVAPVAAKRPRRTKET